MKDDLIAEWAEREKPNIDDDIETLWRAFRIFAAANRWDVTLPKTWASRFQFLDRIVALRALRTPRLSPLASERSR